MQKKFRVYNKCCMFDLYIVYATDKLEVISRPQVIAMSPMKKLSCLAFYIHDFVYKQCCAPICNNLPQFVIKFAPICNTCPNL